MCKVRERNFLRMIFGVSFMRPLLQYAGTDIDQGVIDLMDSKTQARWWIQKSENLVDSKQIQKLGHVNALNFQACLHMLRPSDSCESVNNFLMERMCLPVLVVGGNLPYSLREDCYIFRIKRSETISAFGEEYAEFREFVIKNAEFIKEQITDFAKTSFAQDLQEDSEKYDIFQVLIVVGYVWKMYYESKYSEEKAEDFWEQYRKDALDTVRCFDDYIDYYDIEDELASLVWDFIEKHPEILLAETESVDGTVYKAMQENHAVLFDATFYYFPERLLKTIVQSLMNTMAIGELKKIMKKREIIACDGEGYTVKKRYVTSFGYCGRMRAIKIRKDVLISAEGLMLEEVYGNIPDDKRNMQEDILCER